MNPYRENRLHTFAIKSSVFIAIAAVILSAFSLFLGNSDIPMLLRLIYGIAVFAWFIWTVATVLDHQRKAAHEKNHYIFSFDRSFSVSCHHPSRKIFPALLKISEFMDAYNMSVYDFESRIVRHGIQLAIQEYVDEHPDELIYISPSYD